ncbi:hypothetical protein JW707_02135 [Candidatus Woesearchaeota archaeon]|nr:hypothetical protein [Candidatus Woesearchaeota archaeon]
MEGNQGKTTNRSGKRIDPSLMTIDDIEWYNLHALALIHNNSIDCILGELKATARSGESNLWYGQSKSVTRAEAAAIMVYLKKHGADALEQAFQKYRAEYIP